MSCSKYPSIYQLNTRVFLNELSSELGSQAHINASEVTLGYCAARTFGIIVP